MNNAWGVLAAVLGGAFTLAMVSVVLAQRAQTSSVIQASTAGLAAVIHAAVSPVASSSSTAFGSAAVGG